MATSPAKKIYLDAKIGPFCQFLSVLVSVLLFASVERFSVSRMHDFLFVTPPAM